jgi:hypothetical protein
VHLRGLDRGIGEFVVSFRLPATPHQSCPPPLPIGPRPKPLPFSALVAADPSGSVGVLVLAHSHPHTHSLFLFLLHRQSRSRSSPPHSFFFSLPPPGIGFILSADHRPFILSLATASVSFCCAFVCSLARKFLLSPGGYAVYPSVVEDWAWIVGDGQNEDIKTWSMADG